MAKFFYKAKKGPQNLEQGTIEAETESAAVSKLMQMGYYPISVSLESKGPKEKSAKVRRLGNIPRRDLTTFTRQLADLLESGVTLYKALTVLERQTENRSLKVIIQDIADLVKEGRSLSDSLRSYPRFFNIIYVKMVKVGEISGTLENVLKRLADFGEKQQDRTARLQQALAYPILMLAVGIITILVLFAFVIPKLVDLFEDMGQVLPLPTRILISFSDALLNFWWLILIITLFVAFVLRRSLFTAAGKIRFDYFKLNLPILGKFFKKIEIANFTRTLGILLANGVAVLQAIDSVAQTVESEVLKQEAKTIAKEIKEGLSLSNAVAQSKYFPELVANMINIAEEGGTLDRSLLRVAQAYEKETDHAVRLLTSLIEPIMILSMGSIVGFIVVAMMLPIFQISLIAR